MAESKACPKCGTVMDFRLGMYECPQCGHDEEPSKPEPTSQSSGPGLRREAWHRSQPGTGAQAPGAGQPPLPGQSHVPSPGTLYTPGAAPPPGLYGDEAGARVSKHSTLETEKGVYFGINVALVCLGIIGAFIMVVSGEPSAVANLFGQVIGGAIGLGILYWIFHGASANMKLTCAGCSAFVLMMMVFGCFAAMTMPEFKDVAAYGVIMWGVIFAQVAWTGWFISILWREAMEMRGQ